MTGICVYSFLFRNKTTGAVICEDCRFGEYRSVRQEFKGVFKHFIQYGSNTDLHKCSACFKIIDDYRPTYECRVCCPIEEAFERYLLDHREEPHNSNRRVRINIAKTVW
jgi:hypothetical protein